MVYTCACDRRPTVDPPTYKINYRTGCIPISTAFAVLSTFFALVFPMLYLKTQFSYQYETYITLLLVSSRTEQYQKGDGRALLKLLQLHSVEGLLTASRKLPVLLPSEQQFPATEKSLTRNPSGQIVVSCIFKFWSCSTVICAIYSTLFIAHRLHQ